MAALHSAWVACAHVQVGYRNPSFVCLSTQQSSQSAKAHHCTFEFLPRELTPFEYRDENMRFHPWPVKKTLAIEQLAVIRNAEYTSHLSSFSVLCTKQTFQLAEIIGSKSLLLTLTTVTGIFRHSRIRDAALGLDCSYMLPGRPVHCILAEYCRPVCRISKLGWPIQ